MNEIFLHDYLSDSCSIVSSDCVIMEFVTLGLGFNDILTMFAFH